MPPPKEAFICTALQLLLWQKRHNLIWFQFDSGLCLTFLHLEKGFVSITMHLRNGIIKDGDIYKKSILSSISLRCLNPHILPPSKKLHLPLNGLKGHKREKHTWRVKVGTLDCPPFPPTSFLSWHTKCTRSHTLCRRGEGVTLLDRTIMPRFELGGWWIKSWLITVFFALLQNGRHTLPVLVYELRLCFPPLS